MSAETFAVLFLLGVLGAVGGGILGGLIGWLMFGAPLQGVLLGVAVTWASAALMLWLDR